MDRAAWVLAFARTTQNVRHRTFDTERSTPNVWRALMIAADEAASIKWARSAIMHSYRCFADAASHFGKDEICRAFSTPCLLCMGLISRFLFGGRLARARALLLPDQVHRAGAARRMRGKLLRRFVVGRCCRECRLVGRALSRRDVVQDRREPA